MMMRTMARKGDEARRRQLMSGANCLAAAVLYATCVFVCLCVCACVRCVSCAYVCLCRHHNRARFCCCSCSCSWCCHHCCWHFGALLPATIHISHSISPISHPHSHIHIRIRIRIPNPQTDSHYFDVNNVPADDCQCLCLLLTPSLPPLLPSCWFYLPLASTHSLVQHFYFILHLSTAKLIKKHKTQKFK